MSLKQLLAKLLGFVVQPRWATAHKSILISLFLIIVGFFIAQFASESILDKYYYLQSITLKLKSIFPPIAGYAAKSKFPQVSELYFSYMWLISPVCFWASVQLVRNNEGLKSWKPKTWGEQINVFIVGVLLFSLLGYFTFFINPGYDYNLLPINSSRLALGMFGYIFSGSGGAFLLAGAYCFIEKLILVNNKLSK